jgi:hypothetical protein
MYEIDVDGDDSSRVGLILLRDSSALGSSTPVNRYFTYMRMVIARQGAVRLASGS